MNSLVSRLLVGAALAGSLAFPTATFGQAPSVSRPVVQAIPSADNKKLTAALARIGRDPRDVSALTDAGDAARALNDFSAAIGFYRRAEEISPANAQVKAGLGSALVMTGDPVSAIPAFDAAERAGAAQSLIAADRGLAYDLVGDNATARRYYALALPTVSDGQADELRMRLAVSQAIAGDGALAYKTLLPLLNRQDKPGWRTHAFTLAIAGDTAKAVEVVGKILPEQLADNIAPYLRYMPRLTRAQQAAAADLGRFPRASEIGRDDARIAAYAPPSALAAGRGLIPKGEPLGGGAPIAAAKPHSRTARAQAAQEAAAARAAQATQIAAADPDRVAPPDPKPTIEREGEELPPIGGSSNPSVAARPSTPAPAATSIAQAAPRPTSPAPASAPLAQAVSRPASSSFDLGRLPTSQVAASTPVVASTPVPARVAPPVSMPTTTVAATSQPAAPPATASTPRSLAEIFADLGKPVVEVAPVAGAVDIRLITPAAPPPRIESPPPPVETAPTEAAKLAEARSNRTKTVDPKAKGKKPAIAEEDGAVADDATSGTKKGTAKDEKAATAKGKDGKAKLAETKAEAAKAAKTKKPAPPAHPSRIWVQIGVGRSKDAIAFDWRRNVRQSPALFKGQEAHVSEMGRTNRILVGPFATQKAASAFVADAKKNGFSDVLPWTSPAGQVVDPLDAN